jgi:parvulin-like peptidyl-prolyl isomerase
MTLEVGQVSEKFLSSNGDGYYYVKLSDKTDSEVNYMSLKIKFTTFDEMLANLYKEGEVRKYIEVGAEEEA